MQVGEAARAGGLQALTLTATLTLQEHREVAGGLVLTGYARTWRAAEDLTRM